jgi:hypothetical protein
MTESFFRRNQNSIQLEVEVKSAATREITSSGTMSYNTLPSSGLHVGDPKSSDVTPEDLCPHASYASLERAIFNVRQSISNSTLWAPASIVYCTAYRKAQASA